MSHREYMSHCEWFELKLSMCKEESLLMNPPKFHEDCATSTVFAALLQNLLDIQELESRFNLGLNSAKSINFIDKGFKQKLYMR